MRYIIAAGSSAKESYLGAAAREIMNCRAITFHGMSASYQNKSEQSPLNRLFFNCAMALSSELEPHFFYRELRAIEHRLGRVRSYANAPRTIDLDVLYAFPFAYSSSTFSIPHQELFRRSFFVSCALEVIKSVGWPTPISFYQARLRQGATVLIPCETHL